MRVGLWPVSSASSPGQPWAISLSPRSWQAVRKPAWSCRGEPEPTLVGYVVLHAGSTATSQQLRDHVSAVVSHDMRAPIAGLQGYLEIVDDEEVDPVFVRRIHERCLVLVRRLSLLTEDLQAAAVAAHGDLE